MALSMLRFGNKAGSLVQVAFRVSPASVQVNDKRTLVTKKFRAPSEKPAPYPYLTKPYNWFFAALDDTEARFDEQSRIVVVDGNIATGKNNLAKRIADEFGLLHFSAATMDAVFINEEGFDLRSIKDELPPRTQPIDVASYLADPTAFLVPEFQYLMLTLRFEQYYDAMVHILHTGQGVVMERSVFSDIMFMETMYRLKHVNRLDYDIYNKFTIRVEQLNLFKPHVIIYLEATAESILNRIKARGRPHEVNSKVLTAEFINTLDASYKEQYLAKAKDFSEVLVYDVSEPFDTDFIIQDMEKLQLEKIMADIRDKRMKDWKQRMPREWDEIRNTLTNDKVRLYNKCFRSFYRPNLPHLNISEDEYYGYHDALEKHTSGIPYDFDPERSGNNYLFASMEKGYNAPNRRIFRRTY